MTFKDLGENDTISKDFQDSMNPVFTFLRKIIQSALCSHIMAF